MRILKRCILKMHLNSFRLARQVTKSSQVKVMTLTLFPIKKSLGSDQFRMTFFYTEKSQSHDFDFADSKNKSQVAS
jgi:hypothetical protein